MCEDQLSPCSGAERLTAYTFPKASLCKTLKSQTSAEPPLPPPPPAPPSRLHVLHSIQKVSSLQGCLHPGHTGNFIQPSKQYKASAWNPPQLMSGKQQSRVYQFFDLNWCTRRINPVWPSLTKWFCRTCTLLVCWKDSVYVEVTRLSTFQNAPQQDRHSCPCDKSKHSPHAENICSALSKQPSASGANQRPGNGSSSLCDFIRNSFMSSWLFKHLPSQSHNPGLDVANPAALCPPPNVSRTNRNSQTRSPWGGE